jgi:hypothetical protein
MVPLKPIDLHFAHHIRLHFVAQVPPGTTLEDVANPAYWAHHVQRLRPGALVEVLSEDNSLDCELRVTEVGPTFAKVRVLRNFTPAAAPAISHDAPTDVEVGYGGKADRWRVTHKGQIVASGLGSREDAEKAAQDYRNKFAA